MQARNESEFEVMKWEAKLHSCIDEGVRDNAPSGMPIPDLSIVDMDAAPVCTCKSNVS